MPSQTPEWIAMSKLVGWFFSKADCEPFREEVDWKTLGLFDYPQVVKNPMDLGKVKRNLESGKHYKTVEDCAKDVRLIWKNCMTYNADGSDFFLLAQGLSKKFEEKYAKLVKEHKLSSNNNNSNNNSSNASNNNNNNNNGTNNNNNGGEQSQGGNGGNVPAPSLDDKRTFAKLLYKISKTELGHIIVELDQKCSEALTKNSSEDEVEVDIDKISPALFSELVAYQKSCLYNSGSGGVGGSGGASGGTTSSTDKKKKVNKKQRTS